MKAKHEEVIEAMAEAICIETGSDNPILEAEGILVALQAAGELGYKLVDLSGLEDADDDLVDDTEYNRGKRDGWNAAVFAIEIIELNDGE